MIAALLLVELGVDPEEAMVRVRHARPGAIETPGQDEWIRSGPSGVAWDGNRHFLGF